MHRTKEKIYLSERKIYPAVLARKCFAGGLGVPRRENRTNALSNDVFLIS